MYDHVVVAVASTVAENQVEFVLEAQQNAVGEGGHAVGNDPPQIVPLTPLALRTVMCVEKPCSD